MSRLGVVIVHYRTPALLRDCLVSLRESLLTTAPRVVVVDNASGDGSPEMVRGDFPEVELIVQPRNRGYAHANNLGLRRLGFRDDGRAAPDAPEQVLLLNPDTLLPPDALAQMMQFVDTHPAVGAAGPRLLRPDGSLDRACRRSFPTPEISFYRLTGLSQLFPQNRRFGRYNLTYIKDNESVEVDSVVGAFMLMRRAALEQSGLLDERFFMYGEDLDLAYRIKAAGWQIWYHGEVTVLHYKGASSRQRSRQSIYHFHDAMRLFHEKHYATRTAPPLNWLIRSGIQGRYLLELGRNRFRSPAHRGVGSAA